MPLEIDIEEVAEGASANPEDRKTQARALQDLHAKRWESLLEGLSVGAVSKTAGERDAKTLKRALDVPVRRGVIRFLYIVVDMTSATADTDYKPRRFEFLVNAVGRFAQRFLQENPLAEIGVAALRDGICEEVVPMSTNSDEVRNRILSTAEAGPKGSMSLVNALVRVQHGLEQAPSYGMREALLFTASLSSCDPPQTSLGEVLEALDRQRVRISVISVSPEFFVLRDVCRRTNGTFQVALDADHFEELWHGHLAPPPCTTEPKLIRMGFPRQSIEGAAPSVCACHMKRHHRLFVCPQCHSRVCQVPIRCPVCELSLVSAPVIARTFRHILRVPPYESGRGEVCQGCGLAGAGNTCSRCRGVFCDACDEFVHDRLQQCPGCLEDLQSELR